MTVGPTLVQDKTWCMARAGLREDYEEAWMQPLILFADDESKGREMASARNLEGAAGDSDRMSPPV